MTLLFIALVVYVKYSKELPWGDSLKYLVFCKCISNSENSAAANVKAKIGSGYIDQNPVTGNPELIQKSIENFAK